MRYICAVPILLLIASCSRKEGPSRLSLRHDIAGTVPGVTNCYMLNGIPPSNSGDKSADLVVVGKRPEDSAKHILTTQLTEHERLEVCLRTYDIQKVMKGSTTHLSLKFIVVEQWDGRVMYRWASPWRETLTFHILSEDCRIVNIE